MEKENKKTTIGGIIRKRFFDWLELQSFTDILIRPFVFVLFLFLIFDLEGTIQKIIFIYSFNDFFILKILLAYFLTMNIGSIFSFLSVPFQKEKQRRLFAKKLQEQKEASEEEKTSF